MTASHTSIWLSALKFVQLEIPLMVNHCFDISAGDESGYGVEEMTKSLATFITDVSRVQSSLPEVSASDR